MATFVHQLELTAGTKTVEELSAYSEALVVVRFGGCPLGTIRVRILNGILDCDRVQDAIAHSGLQKSIKREKLKSRLLKNYHPDVSLPACSVVIPTRNRAQYLRRCMNALLKSESTPAEILIVDNAPQDDSTYAVAQQFGVQYVREDRPGLNWARSRGAREAKEEVIAFLDDDIVVDPGWLDAILRSFDGYNVGAVTGLLMPAELETDAQEWFELHGGHRRGFQRRSFDSHLIVPSESGKAGVGGNMAIRRDLILSMKLFDCEMDCGTVTRSGGDTYAFYKLLAAGYSIVYEPRALGWHYHRRESNALRETLKGYGVGLHAALTRELVEHGEWSAILTAISWFWKYTFHRFLRSFFRRPKSLPLSLSVAEIVGTLIGPFAYFSGRRIEREYRKNERIHQETRETARVS